MATQASLLKPFQFQSYKLRVEADEHGNPWFCAKDVCVILGYANDSDTIKKHCRADGVSNRYPIVDALGRTQNPNFISEGNLYRLIIKSNKPEAEPFESWVCDEVLPALRETGSYALPPVPRPAHAKAAVRDRLLAFLEERRGWASATEIDNECFHKQTPPCLAEALGELVAEGLAESRSLPRAGGGPGRWRREWRLADPARGLRRDGAPPPAGPAQGFVPLPPGVRLLVRFEEGGRYTTQVLDAGDVVVPKHAAEALRLVALAVGLPGPLALREGEPPY